MVVLTLFRFAGEGGEGQVHNVHADHTGLQQAGGGLHCRGTHTHTHTHTHSMVLYGIIKGLCPVDKGHLSA